MYLHPACSTIFSDAQGNKTHKEPDYLWARQNLDDSGDPDMVIPELLFEKNETGANDPDQSQMTPSIQA